MARIRMTFYKNSILANIVNLVGTFLNLMGIVYLVVGVMDWMFAIILLGIAFLAAGIGCSVLAAKISERKANRR